MKKQYKEKFYDQLYSGSHSLPPRGFVGKLYNALRKYEIHRENAVYDLLPSGDKLLDIGCGDGAFALKGLNKFKEVYGIDISSTRIQRALEKAKTFENRDKTHFFQIDVDEGLPFEDWSFNAVTCVAVLEHVFDPLFVLDEVHRVLKAGGTFIVEIPNFGWIPYRLTLLMGQLPETSSLDEFGLGGGHLHNFTLSCTRNLLRLKSFGIQTESTSGVFSKFRRFWLSLLGSDLIIKCTKE